MNNNKILGLLPKAIISFNRQEYLRSPLQLTVRKGRTKEEATLPTELEGAVFIVNATGSVSSTQVSMSNNQEDIVLPTDDGWTSILNGDGQIQRLSFKNGQAEWSTAFVKTPSFYADRLVHQGKDSQNRPFPNENYLVFPDRDICFWLYQIDGCREVALHAPSVVVELPCDAANVSS